MRALPILAIALTASAWAQPSATLVPAGSEIVFTTRQMGVPVEGRFRRFSADVQLDPKKPETGKVSLVIDATSARFGTAELDAEIGKPIWLAVARFPQARFDSSAIKGVGSGRYEVSGKLAIKGVAKDVTVPVQLAQAGSQTVASGSFTIKRLDFLVGEAEWADTSLLAGDVIVRFKIALTGLPTP